jgi:hypothetical protein
MQKTALAARTEGFTFVLAGLKAYLEPVCS